MKTNTALALLAASVAALLLIHFAYHTNKEIRKDASNYPFSYCMDNITVSVDSVELSSQPTKGQDTIVQLVRRFIFDL